MAANIVFVESTNIQTILGTNNWHLIMEIFWYKHLKAKLASFKIYSPPKT
jgi:hypothetical protein